MKVLLVEHNRELLDSLTDYLINKGHRVNGVFDGVIAINEFDESYDLVILNSNTPRLNTDSIIKLLKKIKPNLFVFIITDYILIPAETYIENKEVDAFFALPFTYYELDFALRNLKLSKKENDLRLTIKENNLLELIRKKENIPLMELDKKLYRHDETIEIIESLNSKLKYTKIEYTKEGAKEVQKND